MNLILSFDKLKSRIVSEYRKYIFWESIRCPHRDFSLVGPITAINCNITLGKNVTIYPGCMFFGDGPIEIGDNVSIGNNTIIFASLNGGVKIGKDTQIAAQCYIIDIDHGTDRDVLIRTQKNNVSPVNIGEDVWISAGCKILRGTQIGNGAVIGAQSVVKGTIESNAIAVGIPARIKKYRKLL